MESSNSSYLSLISYLFEPGGELLNSPVS